MPYFLLFIAVLAFVSVWMIGKAERTAHPQAEYGSKEWLAAGGVLGAAIFLARFARLPLASVLSALPFILPYLMRADQSQQASPGTGYMSRKEAALILGVSVDAPETAIREAHRKLIAKNHPDKGGSEYLAAKINQARDVLLK